MFDEDEAGRVGRDDAARRLATHAFVHVIVFRHEGQQPEDLTRKHLDELLG
jgi:DNA primase